MSASPLLEQLIEALRCLPGVGQKSAQRMAYHLLERDRDGGRRLAGALVEAVEKIGHCQQCRDFTFVTIENHNYGLRITKLGLKFQSGL